MRKRAKEREKTGQREEVGVCPCAGTNDCTVLHREKPPFSLILTPSTPFIPCSSDSPSASTLSSYIRLFHDLFFPSHPLLRVYFPVLLFVPR